MIDIHSHIIPNVDDGSSSVEESVKMIKEAEKAGFTDIILTPHYIKDYYEEKRDKLLEQMDILKNSINNSECDVKLYEGNEIYITNELDDLIHKNKICNLANSRYLLLELPMNSKLNYIDQTIFNTINMGMIPIIAHPERYKIVQEDYTIIEDFIERGCLIQSNYGSIIGFYGKNSKKTIKQLLKNDLVHFMGTDCHRANTIYTFMPKIVKKLKKVTSKEKLLAITTTNPKKILTNEEIHDER